MLNQGFDDSGILNQNVVELVKQLMTVFTKLKNNRRGKMIKNLRTLGTDTLLLGQSLYF
jgi:hypothetical protein